jgi:hypothetical protein
VLKRKVWQGDFAEQIKLFEIKATGVGREVVQGMHCCPLFPDKPASAIFKIQEGPTKK